MRSTSGRDHTQANDAAGADIDRRRLLLAIAGLPFAAPVAWALAGCSPGEEPAPRGGAEPGPAQTAPRPAAPPAEPPPAQAPPADALVTEIEAMKPMVQALQYVRESTRPDQRCSNCQFFTAKSAERGSCQLFTQGLVAAGGWCTSWTKPASGA